jgi:hypothetical protein
LGKHHVTDHLTTVLGHERQPVLAVQQSSKVPNESGHDRAMVAEGLTMDRSDSVGVVPSLRPDLHRHSIADTVTDPHELYGLPLEQFTDRRNALARELRREGRREEAAAVSKLRKPSVAAWAVNQLVRTQRREVDGLLQAGDTLQQAQADLLSNRGDRTSLRAAMEAERIAVEELTETARGLLNADGHELTASTLEHVTETLHAAALDDEARAKVRDGCLERELRHVGLGATVGAGGRASRTTDRKSRLKAAREAEVAARRGLERATRQLRAAEERRDRLASDLRDAEAAVAAARELAAEAKQEHTRATQRLDRG